MNNFDPLSNARHNLSELIRNAHKAEPSASNQDIKDSLAKYPGVNVGSNLIIQTIGSERDRIPLMQKRKQILPLAEEILRACGDNPVVAHSLINQAVK